METYLGLDLGGTKLLIGEVDSKGNILRYKRYDSGFFDQPMGIKIIRSSLTDYIRTVGWAGKKPVAMGVGLVGRIDSVEGIWLQIDPARTQPVPLAKELSDAFGIPCYINNDVKSSTCAEQIFGTGQLSKDFIYINVGTGIAAGCIVNGQLIGGSHFNAGEVGHMRVGLNLGISCGCGRKDCVELMASGLGLNRCAQLLSSRYETKLPIPTDKDIRISTADIFALSKKGDPLCSQLIENASEALANLIMNLVRVTDPDAVVLGGGVVADGYLHSKILEKLNPTTMRFVTHGVTITKLDPAFIGLLGAVAVAIGKHPVQG